MKEDRLLITITDDKKEKDNSFEAEAKLEVTHPKGVARFEMLTWGDENETAAYSTALEIIEKFKKELERLTK